MPKPVTLVVIVTFGLAFVAFAAAAAGFNLEIPSGLAPLKGRALPTIRVLIANFVVVPLLTGLTLHAFHFAGQATMAFALLSVVAGAPFVAMFTRLAHGDEAYAAAMSLVLMLVTIPFMPLVMPWMLTELHVAHASVTTWALLKPMLWFILPPLGIGIAVRWRPARNPTRLLARRPHPTRCIEAARPLRSPAREARTAARGVSSGCISAERGHRAT